MFYVYILRSEAEPEQFYTGLTDDLRRRLVQHNGGGGVAYRQVHAVGSRAL